VLSADVEVVMTTDRFILINTRAGNKKDVITLRPISVLAELPPPGSAARKFENVYTKLFRDFGDTKVKLGAEHMTKAEKFSIVASALSAASNAWQLSSLMGATSTGMQRFAATMLSAAWATASVQSTIEAQRRMMRDLDFKIIAVDPPKPTFRTDLFR